jgi:hypothetical protein
MRSTKRIHKLDPEDASLSMKESLSRNKTAKLSVREGRKSTIHMQPLAMKCVMMYKARTAVTADCGDFVILHQYPKYSYFVDFYN